MQILHRKKTNFALLQIDKYEKEDLTAPTSLFFEGPNFVYCLEILNS